MLANATPQGPRCDPPVSQGQSRTRQAHENSTREREWWRTAASVKPPLTGERTRDRGQPFRRPSMFSGWMLPSSEPAQGQAGQLQEEVTRPLWSKKKWRGLERPQNGQDTGSSPSLENRPSCFSCLGTCGGADTKVCSGNEDGDTVLPLRDSRLVVEPVDVNTWRPQSRTHVHLHGNTAEHLLQ